MKMRSIRPDRNKGAALLLMVLAMGIVLTALLVSSIGGRKQQQIRADGITRTALLEAKNALIDEAVSIFTAVDNTNTSRPGELLCPDRNVPDPDPNNDVEGTSGLAKSSRCTNTQLIGRIPWRTLHLSHYKDSSGETLWYMLAPPFQERPNQSPISSNTAGPLQVFSDSGRMPLTAAAPNGAVAIIFSPGTILTGQNRSTNAQKTNVNNYLDQITINGQLFTNRANAGGERHLNGPVTCQNLVGDPRCNGNPDSAIVLFNDQLVVITRDELMNRVRQRAVREYPAAMATQTPVLSLDPTCTTVPILSTGTIYDWLPRNNWDTVLTYRLPCTNPPALQ